MSPAPHDRAHTAAARTRVSSPRGGPRLLRNRDTPAGDQALQAPHKQNLGLRFPGRVPTPTLRARSVHCFSFLSVFSLQAGPRARQPAGEARTLCTRVSAAWSWEEGSALLPWRQPPRNCTSLESRGHHTDPFTPLTTELDRFVSIKIFILI